MANRAHDSLQSRLRGSAQAGVRAVVLMLGVLVALVGLAAPAASAGAAAGARNGVAAFNVGSGSTVEPGTPVYPGHVAAISNPNTKISVALDGLDGAGSTSSKVMAGVQRAASGKGSPLDWELLHL